MTDNAAAAKRTPDLRAPSTSRERNARSRIPFCAEIGIRASGSRSCARLVAAETQGTVVGAGLTGRTIAQELARRDYANVVLVDIVENLPQGIALDLDEAAPVLGYEPTVTGSNSYDATAGSDVVVVTAGVPRKPG